MDQCQELAVGSVLPSLGRIVELRKIADGVYWVTTVEHGGYVFHVSVVEGLLSPSAQEYGVLDLDRWVCYEEDCAWSIVALEYPEWQESAARQDVALEMAKSEYPEYLRKRGLLV